MNLFPNPSKGCYLYRVRGKDKFFAQFKSDAGELKGMRFSRACDTIEEGIFFIKQHMRRDALVKRYTEEEEQRKKAEERRLLRQATSPALA